MKPDKNIFIAIALSMVVIIVYPMIINKYYPPVETPVAEKSKETTDKRVSPFVDSTDEEYIKLETLTNEKGGYIGSTEGAATLGREKIIKVNTDLFEALISTNGGAVKSFKLKKYKIENTEESELIDLVTKTPYGLPFNTTLEKGGLTENLVFESSVDKINVSGDSEKSLVLSYVNAEGIEVTKEYVFNGSKYTFNTNLNLKNNSGKTFNGSLNTSMVEVFEEDKVYYHSGPILYYDDDTERHDIDDVGTNTGTDKLDWIGLETKYFLTAILPKELFNTKTSWSTQVPVEMTAIATLKEEVILGSGATSQAKYLAYVGPKELDTLSAVDVTLEEAVEFGIASFLAKPLLGGVKFFQELTGNFGVAIILLTILVKALLYPLSRASFKSMKEMQKIQPQMQALRERYKEDKQKLNKELMELFQRYKINPVGGCFPMLLQIPVFIGLYEAIYTSIELRHAPFFGWITDLSAKDPYFITPVLMGITMYVQQKITPTTLDPMQAKIMLMMPIVLTFVFLNFPAGLMVYWVINNLLTIAQQQYIYKTHN